MYLFDKVLKPNVTQEQVYNASAKSIVKGKNAYAKHNKKQCNLYYPMPIILS